MNKTQKKNLEEAFIEVIRKTSTDLPKDVADTIEAAYVTEEKGSRAEYALRIIKDNIGLARLKSQPLCQDTGSILFFCHYPERTTQSELLKLFRGAVVTATKKGYLRQNSVDSLTGKNSGTNIGPGSPVVHFEPWEKNYFDVRLVLKGGGSENVSIQYSLPDGRLGAGRDLVGVRKCILDAVMQAQGKGCGPGILGVAIGGDRASGYLASKEQFLRKLNDRSRNTALAKLEQECLTDANKLGIGPMGFGGNTTLLGVKITALNRLPASYFLSVSYLCWAFRRQGARINYNGEIKRWLY